MNHHLQAPTRPPDVEDGGLTDVLLIAALLLFLLSCGCASKSETRTTGAGVLPVFLPVVDIHPREEANPAFRPFLHLDAVREDGLAVLIDDAVITDPVQWATSTWGGSRIWLSEGGMAHSSWRVEFDVEFSWTFEWRPIGDEVIEATSTLIPSDPSGVPIVWTGVIVARAWR